MKEWSASTRQFILRHRTGDVRSLALQAARYPDVDMPEAVVQIAGWQIAATKVPSWAAIEDIRYPAHLSMEQCSSEVTAAYKASLVQGDTLVDLTAGWGVDCSFLARKFHRAHYVERQLQLCRLASHNFPLLGLPHVQIHHAEAVDFLRSMPPVDCIFLDPARRDGAGAKTVEIAHCEPNVADLEEQLVQKAAIVMVKLSPMLSLSSALRDLKHVFSLHVVAVNNECKEVIALLKTSFITSQDADNHVEIVCIQAVNNSEAQHFRFTLSEERQASCTWADSPEAYLYEPGAALLKAGPYRLLSARYGVKKLHPNSHLYTSGEPIDFPGRRFRVEAVSGFAKQELRTLLAGITRANLTVRNFPATVAELRKKLKLREGGDCYLFATTLYDGRKVLIRCSRL